MRLTLRGWGVVGVVALAAVLALWSGTRALNAVAAPLVVALAAGAVWVYRADVPTVSLAAPEPGFPGQTRRLRVSLEGSSLVTVRLSLPDGLTGRPVAETVDLPCTVEREVTLARRGVYGFDRLSVTQRDPLGLVARDVTAAVPGEVVVYPARYTLPGAGVSALLTDDVVPERGEFDRLREYVPGDPLRNVHWKSSAKREEFLVMEFASGDPEDSVTVAASATAEAADEMASAVATVADLALAADRAVGVVLPDGRIPPGRGTDHRAALLGLLAETGGGSLAPRAHEDADVSVRAGPEGTTVAVGDRTREFRSIRGGRMAEEVTA